MEGLADGGERGDLVGGGLNVVEADDGDILGDPEAGFVEGANGSHGRDIVEAEDRGEGAAAGDELADAWITDLG